MASISLLSLWPVLRFTNLAFWIFGTARGDEIGGIILFELFPLALCLIAMGVWQPLWKTQKLTWLPVVLLIASLLGPLSALFFAECWIIGYFVIVPLVFSAWQLFSLYLCKFSEKIRLKDA